MPSAKLHRRPFQRRRFWVLFLVFLGVWYLYWVLNRPEPMYSNEPLSYWMTKLSDPATAEQAAIVLRDMGPEGLPTLRDALHVNDSATTVKAYDFVAKLNLAPKRVYDSPEIRGTAAYLLGQMGTNAAPAVPDLIETLDDSDAHVRIRAGRALMKIGTPAVTNLTVALGHSEPLVRLGAAKTLGGIGPEAKYAEGALAKMTNDASADVRQAAARALNEIRK